MNTQATNIGYVTTLQNIVNNRFKDINHIATYLKDVKGLNIVLTEEKTNEVNPDYFIFGEVVEDAEQSFTIFYLKDLKGQLYITETSF